MSSTQPSKLDISAEQLRSIYTQFQTIFDEKVALHLPQEQDSVKSEVLLHLQNFLVEAMETASSSLRVVNATEYASITEILAQSREQFVEPFDLALNEQVRQKYQEWEDQTVRVAQLRREAPRKLREVYTSEAQEVLADADSIIESFKHDNSTAIPTDDELQPSAGWNDLKSDYMEALAYLAQARKQLPQNRAKIQKLEQLVLFLESELGSDV
ncbi:LANO_0E03114g1_1 [Lachancea nothofagi CBS 11611]|uniref:LANO_0E03114g1_1 n=1 Tax=Lachancea nothofagi CBS 11611 TaxID=1266666 RepID=A0A1G4JR81_9SACH|nr:LANO_0E03114g1_1 [Lachancea nothofagi CBS 11611]